MVPQAVSAGRGCDEGKVGRRKAYLHSARYYFICEVASGSPDCGVTQMRTSVASEMVSHAPWDTALGLSILDGGQR